MSTVAMDSTTVRALALAAALLAVHGELHPAADQLAQQNRDAIGKRMRGRHLVYADTGELVGDVPESGRRTLTADRHGLECTARHCASYSAVQAAGALAVTRALGYRLPLSALAAGTAVNAVTHGLLDRGPALEALARLLGKQEYLARCQTVRPEEDGAVRADPYGPGTAWMEIDQASHRLVSVTAAAVTAWLAVRTDRRRVR
ncbi:hypothetical protein ACFZDG_35675 [Kitasatospora xanthocidica]|uniref:hypothetical protein n=1 Tax=Kitasatospora xanthocidica TaxID=83382 RepID=UPI0036E89B31